MKSDLETRAVDFVAAAGPWLGPSISAWLVGRAAYMSLGWPLAVAILAGLVVEFLGLAATNTALSLWNYNRSKRKTDPAGPFILAAVVVAAYTLAAISLTVLLETLPELRTWAAAIFPGLSLCAALVIALRADHKHRLSMIEGEKAAKRAERQESRKLTTVKRQAETVKALRQVSTVKIDGLLDIYKGDPLTTPTQAARALDLSRQTIYTYLAELERSGKIRKNGHGVEVLER